MLSFQHTFKFVKDSLPPIRIPQVRNVRIDAPLFGL
jgi:hypothetical protein